MAWMSLFKAATCVLCGGFVMGLFRGSVPNGLLAGVLLYGICLAIALPVIAFDYLGRVLTQADLGSRFGKLL